MRKIFLILPLVLSFVIPRNYERFINKNLREAKAASYATGVPVSVLFSQAIIESGAGRSNIARKTRNFFGLKCGDNWEGQTYNTSTGCYRSYSSIEESFLDYACFLNENYTGVVGKSYRYWSRYCSGYGGSSNYWNKVGAVIKIYDLDKYEIK
jgi:flagellum-specific peptidoglycan hydrolase FlgJ